ncbi:MAG TPA: cytochrome b/b6 domain-containing protein [Phenylobacterium sp.]|jgi:thiosulfate reductase cytochrome b subunit|nr:cytochrome b/b6 domain-containing protein [Phenylobacterium sp.]
MAAIGVDREAEAPGAGHAAWVRACHWALAATVLALAYSGLVILMAHPRLYWGQTGNDLTHAWIELPLGRNYRHGGWAAPLSFFGDSGPVSRVRTYDIFNQNGWARSLHFLLAWLFAAALGLYLALGLASGHLRRAVVPGVRELAPRHILADLAAHLRLPMPRAPAGPPYNLSQKLAYAGVVLVALPVMILSGLAMSPAVNAAWPILSTIFGGTQSARSIHFLVLCGLALFLAVHLAMVALTGFWRQLRAMTFGSRHEGS